jgi:hypothetical protein
MKSSAESIILSYHQSIALLKNLSSISPFKLELEFGKFRCIVLDQFDKIVFQFNFPLCFPCYPSGQNLFGYANSIPVVPIPYVVLLMHAGRAAFGYVINGDMKHHRVIRKYMVRKKQGKAQYKFQKQKSASSLGARIRMANTQSFFDELNIKLQDWFNSNPVDRIIFSCPPVLWSMLFRSKVPPPFQKHDQRLIKIPLHIPDPLLKTLLYINRYTQTGRCLWFQQPGPDSTIFKDFLFKSINP